MNHALNHKKLKIKWLEEPIENDLLLIKIVVIVFNKLDYRKCLFTLDIMAGQYLFLLLLMFLFVLCVFSVRHQFTRHPTCHPELLCTVAVLEGPSCFWVRTSLEDLALALHVRGVA